MGLIFHFHLSQSFSFHIWGLIIRDKVTEFADEDFVCITVFADDDIMKQTRSWDQKCDSTLFQLARHNNGVPRNKPTQF